MKSAVPEALLRVYVDANVMFSAARDGNSLIRGLWKLRQVEITTSQYAVGETSRNLESHEHRQRFEELLSRTRFVSDADVRSIPEEIELAAKDQPILAAAIAASVDYLITGDRRHFGALYDTTVAGVRVMSPAGFLRRYKERLA